MPRHFTLTGVKTEPTYQEAVTIARDGDLFVVTGGAPAWATPSTESLVIAASGALVHVQCPAGMDCRGPAHPTGFLATALLVIASRHKNLTGRVSPRPFGKRQVFCVQAELIGIAAPLFDPCFDRASGAVLAQSLRSTGQFDGPSLEPTSVRIGVTTSERIRP